MTDLWMPPSYSGRSASASLPPRGPDRPLSDAMSMREVFANYDLVEVTPSGTMVVTRRLADNSSFPGFGEIGSTGQSNLVRFTRDDYNPRLRGRQGLELYDEMRRSDSQVRTSLRLVKTPVLAARWYVEPYDDKKRSQKIADFVWDNLTKWMTTSWPQFLTEALLMMDYGAYYFEKVYDVRPTPQGPMITWRKFAPRHPLSLYRWYWDAHGGPVAAEFHDPNSPDGIVRIPIDKMAVFTFDRESGNLEGISVLRSAYKHWFFKDNLYRIDAIQKERHGIGVPVIKLPPGFTDDDKRAANTLGQNLRTNEKAYITLPPLWEVGFAKLEGQPVDCIASIEHHDRKIVTNVLGQFLEPNAPRTTDQALDVFTKGTRFIAEIVRDTFNRYCIPQLVQWNWGIDEYPELRVRRIGETVDWRILSFALRNLVGAGLVHAERGLEEWLRDEMDLPRMDDPDLLWKMAELLAKAKTDLASSNQDPAAVMAALAPPPQQAPSSGSSANGKPQQPQVGPPRQSQAANQRNAPPKAGRTGDRSGTSGTK